MMIGEALEGVWPKCFWLTSEIDKSKYNKKISKHFSFYTIFFILFSPVNLFNYRVLKATPTHISKLRLPSNGFHFEIQ